jgi:hypothetical protein
MDIPVNIPARRPSRVKKNITQKAGKIRKIKTIKNCSNNESYYCPKGNINLSRILYDIGA